MSSRAEQDDEYLQSITEIMGLLSRSFLDLWERRAASINEDGNLLESVVEEGISEPLHELVMSDKPKGMSKTDAAMFIDFLRSMLRVEPAERTFTSELL